MFQFLIGSLKTLCCACFRHRRQGVSIPHRQSKNDLHTGYSGCHEIVSIPHRQSKNVLTLFRCRLGKKFQFLIGSLKTQTSRHRPRHRRIVSIPHRQSKNGRITCISRLNSLVSIPHRQSKNGVEAPCQKANWKFQFLIGSLKTKEPLFMLRFRKGVSIPHRQSKNAIGGSG